MFGCRLILSSGFFFIQLNLRNYGYTQVETKKSIFTRYSNLLRRVNLKPQQSRHKQTPRNQKKWHIKITR